MGLNLRKLGDSIYHGLNVFDNGQGWTSKAPPPQNNRSVAQQAASMAGGIVSAPVKFVNTVQAGVHGATGLAGVGLQSIFGTDQSYRNSLNKLNARLNDELGPGFGGSMFKNRQEAQNLTPRQLAGKSLGYGSQIASLAAPELKIAKIPSYLARPVGNAVIGGLGSAGAQFTENGRVDPRIVLRDAAVTGVLGEAAHGIKSVIRPRVTARGAPVPDVPVVAPTQIPVKVKPGPRTSQVPVTVTKKVPVRSIPSQEELVSRYNDHIAALNKEFTQNAKPVTLGGNKGILAEPSVYNDVEYAARKQQIQQAYADGTLPKRIPVQDAPIEKLKVALKQPTADLKTLNAKIKNVKDPVRKAELVAEKQAMVTPSPVDKLPINNRLLFGTPERVIKQITKDKAGRQLLTDAIVTPQDRAVAATAKDVEKHLGTLRNIFEGSGILNNTKVDKKLGTHFFNFVEAGGASSKEAIKDLYSKVGKTATLKLMQADKQLRPLMDTLLEQQNAARAAVGKDPIPARANYITHLQDNGFLGGIDLAGASTNAFSRANGRLNPFSKARKGGAYATNPVKATEAYVRAASAEIHAHEPVARINSLVDALEKRGDVPNQVINWLKQQRDIVAGQGHRVDRAVKSTQLGNAALGATDFATKQAGRNLIGLNPSSVLTQPAQIVSAGAKLGWRNTLKSLSAPLKGKALTAESEFLRGRHAHLDQLAPGLGHKLVDLSLKPIEGSQKAIDRITFQAAKHRAGELGLTGEEAIRWATAATKETVGARGLGQTPHAYTSKVGNSILQFSLEMGNSLHQLAADELRHGRIGGIMSFMIGAYGFNSAFNAVTGKSQGVLVDPIQATVDTVKDAKDGNYLAAAARLPGEIVANAPGGQFVAGAIKGMNPKLGEQLFGQSGAGRFGVGVPAVEVAKAGANILKKPFDAAAYAAPTAGIPIKRGIEGVLAVGAGEVKDKAGNVLYKPAKNAVNYTRAALFGKGTTTEGKQYSSDISKEMLAKANGTSMSSGSTGQPTTNEQMTKQAKAERAQLGKTAGNGYTLQQTSDGKYAYTLDGDIEVHTAKDLKSAREAVAKAGFKDEEGSYKLIGDKVYRKGPDGEVTIISKTKFDYQIGTATLTHQKRIGDLQGWMKTAGSQLDSIEKQLKDPNIDPLEAIQLQNQAESLMADMQKYQEYGGFKKGGGSGSSNSAGSVYKYAVSRNAGGQVARPTVSVKFGGTPRVAAARPAGKPKVSLRASRV